MTVLRNVGAGLLILVGLLFAWGVWEWWRVGFGVLAVVWGLVAALCALCAWLLLKTGG